MILVKNRLTMSEWLDSHPRSDAGLDFMYSLSYLLASDNSLQWAAGSLTWPWKPAVGHQSFLIRGEANRIPLGWKIEIQGAERRGDRRRWPLTCQSPSKITYFPKKIYSYYSYYILKMSPKLDASILKYELNFIWIWEVKLFIFNL